MFKRSLSDILIICANLIAVKCTSCASCDINADPLVERGTYLNGFKFWDHRVDHIGSCARICMRMTMCKSFNFDLLSRDCELNRELLENHPEGRGRNRNKVYSEISVWPWKVRSYAIIPDTDMLQIHVHGSSYLLTVPGRNFCCGPVVPCCYFSFNNLL